MLTTYYLHPCCTAYLPCNDFQWCRHVLWTDLYLRLQWFNRAGMERSADVLGEAASFRELLLPEPILAGLLQAGFTRPSPVQQQAIPLARLGADVIVQAKAGTGKTLVFAVTAAEKVDLKEGMPQVRFTKLPAQALMFHLQMLSGTSLHNLVCAALSLLQVLVLAPTREIALQASEVVMDAAAALPPPGLVCGTFIGGLPIEEDEYQLRRWVAAKPCVVHVGKKQDLVTLAPGNDVALHARHFCGFGLVELCLRLLPSSSPIKLLLGIRLQCQGSAVARVSRT